MMADAVVEENQEVVSEETETQEEEEVKIEKKRVCIVGGGPVGLAALRRVLESPWLTGTLFERAADIGGVWNYRKGDKRLGPGPPPGDGDGEKEQDPENLKTMYDDLTCNFPYPLMELQDFPHRNPQRTFLTQQEVHTYLSSYADHFHLRPHIRLNTAVTLATPETPITSETLGLSGRWIVETYNYVDNSSEKEIYDAVIVCVGKNKYPYQPDLPGMDTFHGTVIHSKFFRNSEEFRDKRVVLVGLGPSSADLVLHLSKTAQSVTVCHKFGGGVGLGLLPPKCEEMRNAKRITETGVITEDDEEVPCDAIIFCTGYALKFPYLPCVEVVEQKYVPHMYKMTIFTKRPTLAILNMCYRSPEIIVGDVQAQYVVAALENQTFHLPSYEEMEADVIREENEKRAKEWPISWGFQVGNYGMGTLRYFREFYNEMGQAEKGEEKCRKWPLLDRLIAAVFAERLFGKLALYKKDKFRYVSEWEWEYVWGEDLVKYPEFPAKRVRMILDRASGKVTAHTEDVH